MKKLLLLPLDERPCNYNYQQMMLSGTDYELLLPPKEILSKKKECGEIALIHKWVKENAKDCDGAVISIDTLVYSGILPSRLHHENQDTLLKRLETLTELKEQNPALKLYAFNLIMRCPQYSSSDEEPDYYEDFGREIFRFGDISHKIEAGVATEEEKAELESIKLSLPAEYLDDYVSRRKTNIEINKKVIELAGSGVIDFLIIPQDDSSPYGFTAKDQQCIRDAIKAHHVSLKAYMYPDADAVENTLLARMINNDLGVSPLVYIKYASSMGDSFTPAFEDRLISETIKYHIIAAGGIVASCATEADIILMVNSPSGSMLCHDTTGDIPRTIEYDANRTMIEQIVYAKYAMNTLKKKVAFADVAYGNGGDPALLELLKESGLLYELAGYAGWNTNSNTVGTCVPMSMLYLNFGKRQAHTDFLALRYVEDIGYMAYVRKDICTNYLEKAGLTYFKIDGTTGETAKLIHKKLQEFADNNLCDESHKVIVTECCQPWNRMFETGIKVAVK